MTQCHWKLRMPMHLLSFKDDVVCFRPWALLSFLHTFFFLSFWYSLTLVSLFWSSLPPLFLQSLLQPFHFWDCGMFFTVTKRFSQYILFCLFGSSQLSHFLTNRFLCWCGLRMTFYRLLWHLMYLFILLFWCTVLCDRLPVLNK